jgi:hypothetical protein
MSFAEIKILSAIALVAGFCMLIFWIIKEKLKSRGFDLDTLDPESGTVDSFGSIALKKLIIWVMLYSIFGAAALFAILAFNIEFDDEIKNTMTSAGIFFPFIYILSVVTSFIDNAQKRRKLNKKI